MLKAIIFDMDGVLIDSEPLHAKAAIMTLKEFGVTIPVSLCYNYIGSTTRHMYEDIANIHHIKADIEDLLRLDHEHKDALIRTEGYPAIPHICKLVRSLHQNGFLTAVASSSTMSEIRSNIASIGIADCFDCLVSGTEVAHPKPAPDVFLKASAELGVQPNEALIIEDSSFGVQAAKAAGTACVGFANPNSGKQDLHLADIIVEGFEEVDSLFLTQVWERFQNLPLTIANTSRTILRELCMEDFDAYYKLIQNPEIACALIEPPSSESEEREKLCAYIQSAYRFYGYGLWGIFSKEDNRLIGRCGLQAFTINGTAQTEIGYYLHPAYQHKGIAFEAASQVLELAKERYEFPRIYARIAPDNASSIRLAEKLGLKQIGTNQGLLLFCTEPL